MDFDFFYKNREELLSLPGLKPHKCRLNLQTRSIGKPPADTFSSECTWRQTLSWTRSIRFAEQRRKFSQSGWKDIIYFSDQTAKDKKVISQFDFSTVHFYGLHDFRQKDTQTNAIKMMPN
jgi:hypothetical protein